jgi:hypothetical protein
MTLGATPKNKSAKYRDRSLTQMAKITTQVGAPSPLREKAGMRGI